VPELARIADTRLLDLHPALKTKGPVLRDAGVSNPFGSLCGQSCVVADVILFYLRPELLSDEAFELLRQQWKCPLFGMNLDDKASFSPMASSSPPMRITSIGRKNLI